MLQFCSDALHAWQVALDRPDPGVLFWQGAYYAVTTSQAAGDAFEIRRSPDLVNWQKIGSVFPQWRERKNPSWASRDFWAPELHVLPRAANESAFQFRCYFAARHATTGRLSIGVGSAMSIEGPYTDLGQPLVARTSNPGVIDATFFTDHANGNRSYLIWKIDVRRQSVLHLHRLNSVALCSACSREMMCVNRHRFWPLSWTARAPS